MRIQLRVCFTVLLLSGLAIGVIAGEKPIRILIVTGEDYPGHKWRETTPLVRSILSQKEYFDVRVCEDIEIFAAAPELRYDAIVLHYCNWESPMPSLAAREGLARFVAGGKGLVALHFTCGAFREWPNYQTLAWPEFEKIVGRVWDTDKTHDPYQKFQVKVLRKDHPITHEMSDFDIEDELYFCLEGEPQIEVLLTAHSTVTQKDEPMGFVLEYGSGRVFHTPLGHDVKSFQAPGMAPLLQRACEWAATGAVTRFDRE